MEYLYQLISSFAETPEQVKLLFLAFVSLAVLMVAFGVIGLVLGLTDPAKKRLRAIINDGDQKSSSWSVGSVAQALTPLSPYVIPKNLGESSKTRIRLVNAGFINPNALVLFYSLKTLSLVGILLVTMFICFVVIGLPTYQSFKVLMGVIVIAMIAPGKILDHLVKKRQRALRIGFPDALDLLVVCTEAGLGLNGALQRVADELFVSHPVLAGELNLVNIEIQAGIDRNTALKNLNDRTGLDNIAGLVAALSQSIQFGTSIADTLRVYSEELRDKRMQAAEEKAAKLGTKMIFPLIICLWPGFFTVAIGPAVIGLIKVFQDL